MTTSGPRDPTTAISTGSGNVSWVNPTNVAASDDSNATATNVLGGDSTRVLYASTYGFTIPAGSTILGVTVEVEKHQSASSGVVDRFVHLVKDGTVLGNNLKTHVVYGDKHECVVLEEECKPGAVSFYVSNTSKEMNIAAYAFTY